MYDNIYVDDFDDNDNSNENMSFWRCPPLGEVIRLLTLSFQWCAIVINLIVPLLVRTGLGGSESEQLYGTAPAGLLDSDRKKFTGNRDGAPVVESRFLKKPDARQCQ